MKQVLKSSLPLVLLVAITALGLGVWLGAGDGQPEQHNNGNVADEIDISEFLTQTYPDPIGEDIVVKEVMGELNLINFWATWCAPCRHEMPVFEALYQQHKDQGFSVIGLTIDDPEPAEAFLQSVGVTYPAPILGDQGWELLGTFGNKQGLLPYSILTDKQGVVLERKLGEIDADLLSEWIEKYLNKV